MSHNDREDNFPLATTLAGKRKAEDGSVGAAAATARKTKCNKNAIQVQEPDEESNYRFCQGG
jgi:hypothetical protein